MGSNDDIKGRFTFRDLPFEKVIDTKYQLQTKKYYGSDEYYNWDWVTLCTGDYDYVYSEYKRVWSNLECRMLQIETTVWEMDE